MDASDRARLLLPALCLLAAAVLTATPTVRAADAEQGSWVNHQVNFNYMGDVTTGTTYSCVGLEDDLSFLLRQSGARLNAPVQVSPCVNGAGAPSTLLTAKLNFSTFHPAGEVNGANQGNGGTQSPPIMGSWRTVLFSEPHSFPTLRFSDCELVSEFKDKLLGYFATRDMQANLPCIPFQSESGLYGLQFKAFVPTDTPKRQVGGG